MNCLFSHMLHFSIIWKIKTCMTYISIRIITLKLIKFNLFPHSKSFRKVEEGESTSFNKVFDFFWGGGGRGECRWCTSNGFALVQILIIFFGWWTQRYGKTLILFFPKCYFSKRATIFCDNYFITSLY